MLSTAPPSGTGRARSGRASGTTATPSADSPVSPANDAVPETVPAADIDTVHDTDTDTDTVHGTDPAPRTSSAASRPVPWLLLAGVVALLIPLRGGFGPVRDINDLFWHILYGQEILGGTPVADAGHGWSFAPVADTWVSTQWLAEVFFGKLEQVGGLQALIVYRAVMGIATLAVLAAVTLVRRPTRAGVWLFTLGAVAVSFTIQERTQQVTFLLAPLVGWWAYRLWRDSRLPQWWLVLPLTVVWANVHGGWVILPAALALASVARLLDLGWRDQVARHAVLLAAGTMVAACVSPTGIDNALAMLRFSSSTVLINEWQPVVPWNVAAAPLMLLVLTAVIAWARGAVRPSRGELVLVLGFVVFGLVAWRDVTPAVLILCPIVTGTVARAMRETDPSTERAPLARTALALGVLGAVIALSLAVRQDPMDGSTVPTHLIDRIAATTSDQRVLNTWNLSGPVLWFGGRPPKVTVAADGRADRYGGAFISRYNDTLAARPGWQQQVDQLDPTVALLRDDEALVGALVAQRGWVQVGTEGIYVLLHAPDAPGWPST